MKYRTHLTMLLTIAYRLKMLRLNTVPAVVSRLLLLLCLLASLSEAVAAETVTLRFGNDRSLSLPVTDLFDEATRQKVPCLSNTDLIDAFHQMDRGSRVTWENLNNILRINIKDQRFTLFLDYSNMMANESLVSVKHSLKLFEGEVYIPLSTVQMLLQSLGDAKLLIPQSIQQRQGEALPDMSPSAVSSSDGQSRSLLPGLPPDRQEAEAPAYSTAGAQSRDRTKTHRIVFELGGIYALDIPEPQKAEMGRIFNEIANDCGRDLANSGQIEFVVLDPQNFQPVNVRLNNISAENPDVVILLKPGFSRFQEVEGIRIYHAGAESAASQVPLPPSETTQAPRARDWNYLGALAETRHFAQIIFEAFSDSPMIQANAPQSAGLFIPRRLDVPVLLIELGYYSNPHDDQLLRRESDYFSRVLAESIRDYLGI